MKNIVILINFIFYFFKNKIIIKEKESKIGTLD